MSSLILDYTNCLAASIGATHGLTDAEIDTLVAKFPKHHENIEELRSTGESGFFDLPYQNLDALNALVKEHAGKWDDLVLIGTAGATIGTIALFKGLCHEQHNLLPAAARKKTPRFTVIDNCDPRTVEDIFAAIDAKKTLFILNTKSGNTAEANALFLWLIATLRKKVGKGAPAKQLILCTEAERSILTAAAKEEKIATLPIPNNLTGRFAVLHASSLLPAALLGIDVKAVLAGAEAMDKRTRHDKAMNNPAYMHSLIHYLLTRKRRKTLHATMVFSNRLNGWVDWYNHLLAVSLGKMLNKKGKAVHVGPSPAEPCGPAGGYGQMQLYQEGPFDKVTCFITCKNHGCDLEIPNLWPKQEGLSYLANRKASEIIDMAYFGAAHAITSTGRPNMTVHMDDVSPQSLGGLIYMFQLSTVMSAELYGIDSFDQPGVDLNKQAIFAQLGRPGFEDKASALKAYRARPVKSC